MQGFVESLAFGGLDSPELAEGEGLLSACDSFKAGTKVILADGKTKPIDQITAGDKVVATDPSDGATSAKTVEGRQVHLDTELTDVEIRDEKGHISTLHTTPNHPIWDQTDHAWMPASAIDPGDMLYALSGTATVVNVLSFQGSSDMYNLTVSDLHAYYILVGDTAVLVHNQGGKCPVGGFPHGPVGEAATFDRLGAEGYTDIVKGVAFKNSNGDTFIADFVARGPAGNWVAIDAKTGAGAEISPNQAIGYPELNSTGAILNSTKIPGIKKGSMVTMTVVIDAWTCPVCNP